MCAMHTEIKEFSVSKVQVFLLQCPKMDIKYCTHLFTEVFPVDCTVCSAPFRSPAVEQLIHTNLSTEPGAQISQIIDSDWERQPEKKREICTHIDSIEMTLFEGLDSEHMQEKYYKEKFGYLVGYKT